jgi:hypothetical protein
MVQGVPKQVYGVVLGIDNESNISAQLPGVQQTNQCVVETVVIEAIQTFMAHPRNGTTLPGDCNGFSVYAKPIESKITQWRAGESTIWQSNKHVMADAEVAQYDAIVEELELLETQYLTCFFQMQLNIGKATSQ